MFSKILLATDNPHKQEKLKWIVDGFFNQIDLPKKPLKIKEAGGTFEQIAKKKALWYGKNYDGFAIATDGGMEIPALGNSWNALLTKRFKKGSDFDRMNALLRLMEGKEDRRMQWKEAVAIAYSGRIVFSTTVEGAKGLLQTTYDRSKYKKGIWLCSLWYFPTYKKNYFDLRPRQVDFAEVSWLRIRRKVLDFFSVSYGLRLEQEKALRKVKLISAFTLKNWPQDPLMETIKSKSLPIINKELKNLKFYIDEKDLKYQVLFRLTTYEAKEIFNQKLEEYLRRKGAYESWRNILKLNEGYLKRFRINKELVKSVIREQIQVGKIRIKKTRLPLSEILKSENEVFKSRGWVIKKSFGKIYAAKGRKKKELTFRRVDKNYAKMLHRQLHYIHFPRVHQAFGLFIKGEKRPFSVLGVEKIDRDYKKTAVLLKGFDYKEVVDFTRLYSFPGSPMNTSSVIFSLTRDYYRRNGDVQAALSAFMPSYANGMSMFAGGLDTVLIAKPLCHVFVQIPGTKFYKHVVKRAQVDLKHRTVVSKIPLLPTLELLSPIIKPPLLAKKELDSSMIDLT